MSDIKRASIPVPDPALYLRFQRWAKKQGMTFGAAIAQAMRAAMEATK